MAESSSPDNDLIHDLWEFGPERVYILVAIARSKDNDGIRATDQPVIRKVVEDEDEIDDKIAQLEHATSRFPYRYRLYATVNARNTVVAFRRLQDEMTQWTYKAMKGDEDVKINFKRVDHEWKSILHQTECRDDKHFLFDLDGIGDTPAKVAQFRTQLAKHTVNILVKESPNGYHIVTKPFNHTEFESDIDFELKTDDMVFVRFLGEDCDPDRIQIERHLAGRNELGVYYAVVESGNAPETLFPTDERLFRAKGKALVMAAEKGTAYEVVPYEETGAEGSYLMERIDRDD